MATQYTSRIRIALPVTGELDGTWGTVQNTEIFELLDDAIAGLSVINTWTTNEHTLTTLTGTGDEARAAILRLTDTGAALTGTGALIIPQVTKQYIIINETSEDIVVRYSVAGGTSATLVITEQAVIASDGLNVRKIASNIVDLGDSITGTIDVDLNGVFFVDQASQRVGVSSDGSIDISDLKTSFNIKDSTNPEAGIYIESNLDELTMLLAGGAVDPSFTFRISPDESGGNYVFISDNNELASIEADGDVVARRDVRAISAVIAGDSVEFGEQALGPNGSATDPTYSFNGDSDTGMYRVSSDNLGFSVDGTRRMNMTTALMTLDINGRFNEPVDFFGMVDFKTTVSFDDEATFFQNVTFATSIGVVGSVTTANLNVQGGSITGGLFTDNGVANNNAKFVRLTQAQYDALGTPDANTIYFVTA